VGYTIKANGGIIDAGHVNQLQTDIALIDIALAAVESAVVAGPAYVSGGLITDYFIATAGRTFPTNASIRPDGTTFVPTIAAVTAAPDTYWVTFTPTATGAWLFDVTDSAGERWMQVYQVRAT